MKSSIISIALLAFIPTIASAQLGFEPLYTNYPLLQSTTNATEPTALDKAAVDTLPLPFVEDFSYRPDNNYPSMKKWVDSMVYINHTFPIHPPTYGVATFDGLNKYAAPYSTNILLHAEADTLTSKPIDLSNLTIADSVYLSFYYQAGGRGDMPEISDSIMLEVKSPATANWERIWSKKMPILAQTTSKPFQSVRLLINNPTHLKRGFQFRFRNFANLSSNADHWHIDYIRLNKNRNQNDTLVVDAAFTEPASSLLKEYYSMPWQHFLINPLDNLKDSLITAIYNNNNTNPAINYQAFIKNINTASNASLFNGNENAVPVGDLYFRTVVSPVFNAPMTDNAAFFEIIHQISLNQDILKRNDTLVQIQAFSDYYSYDDGSAEVSVFLQNNGGASNGMLAYQYNTKKADSLKAVDIFFNRMLTDVSNKTFYLTIWADNAGKPGNVIYTQANTIPTYHLSHNIFHRYYLDSILYLEPGTYYIGWIQGDNFKMQVGFDRNTSSENKIYVNFAGNWLGYSANEKGSLMMRPVVGSEVIFTAIPPISETTKTTIYPNPTSQEINIQTDALDYEISIYDLASKLIYLQSNTKTVPVENIPNGIYLLQLKDKHTQAISHHKIVISK